MWVTDSENVLLTTWQPTSKIRHQNQPKKWSHKFVDKMNMMHATIGHQHDILSSHDLDDQLWTDKNCRLHDCDPVAQSYVFTPYKLIFTAEKLTYKKVQNI